jgi:hypothetical protein
MRVVGDVVAAVLTVAVVGVDVVEDEDGASKPRLRNPFRDVCLRKRMFRQIFYKHRTQWPHQLFTRKILVIYRLILYHPSVMLSLRNLLVISYFLCLKESESCSISFCVDYGSSNK